MKKNLPHTTPNEKKVILKIEKSNIFSQKCSKYEVFTHYYLTYRKYHKTSVLHISHKEFFYFIIFCLICTMNKPKHGLNPSNVLKSLIYTLENVNKK